MGKTSKKVSFYVNEELEQELAVLKKEQFYDKSWSELYKFLIAKGLETAAEANRKG